MGIKGLVKVKKKCSIFAAYKIENYDRIVTDNLGYIICADGGFVHTEKLGISPQLVVGDFDSVNPCGKYKDIIKVYPSEKDDSDLMLAVRAAIKEGCTYIDIYGATGGRLDHTIASLQTLLFAQNHGAEATLIGDSDEVCLLKNGSRTFEKRKGWYFSIFSVTEECIGVTLEGLKYPLNNYTVTNSFPIGLSNEIIAEKCKVFVEKGILFIVFSKK